MSYFRMILLTFFFASLFSCQNQTSLEYITVYEFYEQREQMDVVILDVRTPVEVEQGNIPGAIHMDYYDDNFQQELEKLDKTKAYLVYCKSGGRSNDAAVRMVELGFSKIYDLEGGITAWLEAGYELE